MQNLFETARKRQKHRLGGRINTAIAVVNLGAQPAAEEQRLGSPRAPKEEETTLRQELVCGGFYAPSAERSAGVRLSYPGGRSPARKTEAVRQLGA